MLFFRHKLWNLVPSARLSLQALSNCSVWKIVSVLSVAGLKALEHLFFFKLVGDAPIDTFLLEMLEAPIQ